MNMWERCEVKRLPVPVPQSPAADPGGSSGTIQTFYPFRAVSLLPSPHVLFQHLGDHCKSAYVVLTYTPYSCTV